MSRGASFAVGEKVAKQPVGDEEGAAEATAEGGHLRIAGGGVAEGVVEPSDVAVLEAGVYPFAVVGGVDAVDEAGAVAVLGAVVAGSSRWS